MLSQALLGLEFDLSKTKEKTELSASPQGGKNLPF